LREQEVLLGTPPKEYPFPVAAMGENRYKIHAVVTNRDIPAPDLVVWYHKRCGHSEEVHAILKMIWLVERFLATIFTPMPFGGG
jgi:hypothetical protein